MATTSAVPPLCQAHSGCFALHNSTTWELCYGPGQRCARHGPPADFRQEQTRAGAPGGLSGDKGGSHGTGGERWLVEGSGFSRHLCVTPRVSHALTRITDPFHGLPVFPDTRPRRWCGTRGTLLLLCCFAVSLLCGLGQGQSLLLSDPSLSHYNLSLVWPRSKQLLISHP